MLRLILLTPIESGTSTWKSLWSYFAYKYTFLSALNYDYYRQLFHIQMYIVLHFEIYNYYKYILHTQMFPCLHFELVLKLFPVQMYLFNV